jgi:hypothetical protein
VWKHKNGSTDFGIIPYWWQKFIDITANTEEVTLRFYLPLYELLNYKWDDIILVNNIQYIAKSFTRPRPYTGFIQMKLQKIMQ